ncbi:DUF3397 family protein [Fervidibacillus halotolerans]|uniref:DUF3397 domain-containing protein n=1 Tax=Fervidibacillus halotolerans TaxID=2980027 RepID=A0A9E8M1A5_9BACI|nr:DUF3397 family protein [Fervidibacillus halotolerans]WAA13693.1 DUF3397 domain-containing protein [Fervidibacillus halotolerans]
MAQLFTSIITFFIFSPLFFFLLLLFILNLRLKDDNRSFKLAADGSVPFLLLSVYFLMEVIWEKSFFLLFLLLLILLFCLFAFIYWKKTNRFDMKLVFHKFWRMLFLLFGLLYVVFMVYGLLSYAFRYL